MDRIEEIKGVVEVLQSICRVLGLSLVLGITDGEKAINAMIGPPKHLGALIIDAARRIAQLGGCNGDCEKCGEVEGAARSTCPVMH